MVSDEFKDLVHCYFMAIAHQNDLLADIAMSDNPVHILQMRIDVADYQEVIHQAERLIAMLTGGRRP